MRVKILFAGGGSGGHIFPIIAVARELRRIYPSIKDGDLKSSKKEEEKKLELFYIGPKDYFEKIFLSQEGIKVKEISAGKIRRYLGVKSILQTLIDVFIKTPIGFFQAFFFIFFLSPDLVFSKGGFGSVSSVFAAWILQIPIFLHESDIVPGLANKILSGFALEIFISFSATEYFPVKKMILVGNPIRNEILEGTKDTAKFLFQIAGQKPVILILGGSQGAKRINNTVLEILPDLLTNFEIIHQAGENNFEQIQRETNIMLGEDQKRYYHLFPFFKEDKLKYAYKIADFVVSRAGAGSIFEIAALGKPSMLIPLSESAQNHQLKNAYFYSRNGSCLVMEEANLTPHFFLEKLRFFFTHPRELEKMREVALEFSKPMAAKVIAGYITSYLTK